ncbi:MAG: hypothetical protein QOD75_3962 [Blastocatellia bacterium]|jgi:hypothetical protein|nr:hypothetical protein [Blastocatellia bacterium]
MKRIAIFLVLVLAASAVAQGPQRYMSWDGFVQRGKVKVRAGGSTWSVNGQPVSHTVEIYESTDMARYIFTRLRGKVRPASDIAPNAGSIDFKITTRISGTRIAWVCGEDLRYVEAKSYVAALALLASWGPLHCG